MWNNIYNLAYKAVQPKSNVFRSYRKTAYFITKRHKITTTNSEEFTERLYNGVINGERSMLARAITLVESQKQEHRHQAEILLSRLLKKELISIKQRQNNSFRIAFSGSPGAGKSTFIEAFGCYLLDHGFKVAVLAVDPSSKRTGGSVMGDKTRMDELSRNPNAYVRPSPSRCTLGGVTRKTNESIILCESAGYDIILVETVGVGQSETMVHDMVDLFTLVVPPASGDDLQGIKRGIVELSDIVLINKSDGDLLPAARRAKSAMHGALKFMRPTSPNWNPKVLPVSSKLHEGLDKVWEQMCNFNEAMKKSGEFQEKRKNQRRTHLWNYLNDQLIDRLKRNDDVKKSMPAIINDVDELVITAERGAEILLERFLSKQKNDEIKPI